MAAPPPPPFDLKQTVVVDTVITSEEILTSLYISALTGLAYLAGWACLRGPFRRVLVKRNQLTDLFARPPPLRIQGFVFRCFGWLWPVFILSDGDFVQTAGLDALIITRFLVLGIQLFTPISVVCCAVLLPLCLTGTFVEDNTTGASTSTIMRYSISNIQPGSEKLWACFGLSYVVLAYTGFCLYRHYQSYALLRLVHIRHSSLFATHGAPMQKIVGMKNAKVGWPAVGHKLMTLISPSFMVRADEKYVKRFLKQMAALEVAGEAAQAEEDAAEAAAAAAAAASGKVVAASESTLALADLAHCEATREAAPLLAANAGELGKNAILPWWLPAEDVPPQYSAILGSPTPCGKTDPVTRSRVLGTTSHGQRVWAPAGQYAVLFTVAGPLPSEELWRLLRPATSPLGVTVDSEVPVPAEGDAADYADAHSSSSSSGAGGSQRGDAEGEQPSSPKRVGDRTLMLMDPSGGQKAGEGAELVAAQLKEALTELFPASFAQLVRVYNHMAVDQLIVKYDLAAAARDRAAVSITRLKAKLGLDATPAAAETAGQGGGSGASSANCEAGREAEASGKSNGQAEAAPGGKRGDQAEAAGKSSGAGLRHRLAARSLRSAEAAQAKWSAQADELELQVAAARQAALDKPLGTAFIALFKDQTSAAIAGNVNASLVAGVNLNVRSAPGPDNVNWPALWSTWGQRVWRGACVVPLLTIFMIFPIGILVGALTNLSTAVCGGTPETNSLYWPWYCAQDDFWSRLFKSIVQGILPSIISMMWDTFISPMVFYLCAQSERRHLALSDLDKRIIVLFWCFDLFNTFLGAVLGGVAFQQLGAMLKDPTSWLTILGAALPSSSTFFLNYIIISALSSNFSRFCWPHLGVGFDMVWTGLRMFRPTTVRDATVFRYPPSFRPPRQAAKFFLITIMGLSYAVIAPLTLPAAACFFVTGWIVWRYHALYLYQRSYESGGRVWETFFALWVWVMFTFTLFSAIVLLSKTMYTAGLVMLFTQIPAVFIYRRKVTLSVGHYAALLPLQATLDAPKADVPAAMYVPPPLRPHAVGWYPEWGKVWEWYGLGRYSI